MSQMFVECLFIHISIAHCPPIKDYAIIPSAKWAGLMIVEYKVKIDAFEGPLDLLLHLIKQLEIDIYDIPVADITEQYLDFIHQMQVLELDVASEYLVMAATLIEMKSKMLLPKQELLEDDFSDLEIEAEEDPRDELIRRLIEYRQYKQVAQELKEYERVQSHLYTKPLSDLSEYARKGQPLPMTGRVTVNDMMSAFQNLLRKNKMAKPIRTTVQRQSLPVGKRMTEIVDVLKRLQGIVTFDSLFPYPDRSHVIVTFLALLELMKKQQIACVQDHNFTDISISLMEGAEKIAIDGDESSY